MGLFGKKKDKEKKPEAEEQEEAEEAAAEAAPAEEKPALNLGTIEAELTRIKAQLESFGEIRKANAERFERVSEQIGELRGMITDTNKTLGQIEVSSTKAVDLVGAVQPDKLMIEVKRSDGKVEALHANIESNESIMKDIMKELKSMRQQMSFYKGVDQVVKMNDDMKKEIFEMKRMQATIERHADKVESIFLEIEKRVAGFDAFNDMVKDHDRTMKKLLGDFDKMKVNIDSKSDKKDFQKLLTKFENFEKHTANVLKLLDQRSKTTRSDIEDRFEHLRDQLSKKFSVSLKDRKPEHEPEEISLVDQAAVASRTEKPSLFSRILKKKKDGGNDEKPADGAKPAEAGSKTPEKPAEQTAQS